MAAARQRVIVGNSPDSGVPLMAEIALPGVARLP